MAAQQFENAFGSGGDKAGKTDGHPSDIDGMESIDVLAVIDGFDDALLADMTWERKLHDEAIDAVVMVQLVDATQKFCLGDVVFIANQAGLEAASSQARTLLRT